MKRLAGKTFETSTIIGSAVSAPLNFCDKAVGSVPEHTWALIVFVAGSIGV